MKMIVEQAFIERVDPISEKLNAEKEKIKELRQDIKGNSKEIKRVDEHYTDVCKALLRVNGIQVRDMDSHNIFKEFE
jgi:hypothetical protein